MLKVAKGHPSQMHYFSTNFKFRMILNIISCFTIHYESFPISAYHLSLTTHPPQFLRRPFHAQWLGAQLAMLAMYSG
jgi:hypothetical protein